MKNNRRNIFVQIEFTKDMQFNTRVAKEPVRLVREVVKKERNADSKALYKDSALLPHYTGYLPGHKFRYALTYGNSSKVHAPYLKQ